MGRHHSEKMKIDGRGEVVALFDTFESAAQGIKQDFWPSASICPRVEDLFALDNVDAVIIGTPTAEHYSQATICLDRGWHVLCEKPLASNRQQILELIAAYDRCRKKAQGFSLAYQRRFWSRFRTLRREVQSGKWGAVKAILSHNIENWQSTITGTWRNDPAQNPGGFVADAGSHKIDAIFYTTGLAPVDVFARSVRAGSNVEIVSSVSAKLTSDVLVTMDFVGLAQYLDEDLCIHCEHADLMLRHDELWIGRNGEIKKLVSDEPESDPVGGFLDAILNGKEDLSPPSAALPVYDVTQAILESSRTGLPVIIANS